MEWDHGSSIDCIDQHEFFLRASVIVWIKMVRLYRKFDEMGVEHGGIDC